MVTAPYLLYRCQKKFSSQSSWFIPAEVYTVMMDISPLFTFQTKGPGTLLWLTMTYSLTYDSFANSEAGALTRIASFLKRPVEVRPDLTTICDKKEAITACVIEHLLVWYNASDREVVDWEVHFCFKPYQIVSRQGELSELSKLFIEAGSNFSIPADQSLFTHQI